MFPIPLNQVNNQNNIMLDQCTYACANKGLPSSMQHYSYQWGSSTNSTHYLKRNATCWIKACIAVVNRGEPTTASYEEYATAVRELTAYKEQLEVLQKGFAVSEVSFVKGVETALPDSQCASSAMTWRSNCW